MAKQDSTSRDTSNDDDKNVRDLREQRTDTENAGNAAADAAEAKRPAGYDGNPSQGGTAQQ